MDRGKEELEEEGKENKKKPPTMERFQAKNKSNKSLDFGFLLLTINPKSIALKNTLILLNYRPNIFNPISII